MKALLLPTKTYCLNGRLWLETDDGHFLGIGRLELLEQIATLGSISKAAQAKDMSYKGSAQKKGKYSTLSYKSVLITSRLGQSKTAV